jgi:hypothetical protein
MTVSDIRTFDESLQIYSQRTAALFVVKKYTTVYVYGCETWSLTLREEHGLTFSENRLLRKTFGPNQWRTQEFFRGGGGGQRSERTGIWAR